MILYLIVEMYKHVDYSSLWINRPPSRLGYSELDRYITKFVTVCIES